MPAIGFTQSIDTIREDYDGLSSKPGEFERAYGNRWPGDTAHVQVIPAADWAACRSTVTFAGRQVWAVAVSEDRDWAAIGAAGPTPDGRELVELIAYRCEGTSWVVPELIRLRERHGRVDDVVGVDPASPAGSLIPDLEDADFTVKRIPAQGKAHACGAFYDAAVSIGRPDGTPPRLAHRGQTEITTAVEGATRRYVGEKAFVFEPGPSMFDICALHVVVYALWTHHAVPDDWYDVRESFL